MRVRDGTHTIRCIIADRSHVDVWNPHHTGARHGRKPTGFGLPPSFPLERRKEGETQEPFTQRNHLKPNRPLQGAKSGPYS